MTHEPVNSVQGDIAYMKSLAEEGRQAPLLVGPILVTAALWFGLATLGQWAISTDLLPLSGWSVMFYWLAVGVGFAIVLFFMIARIPNKQGASTKDNIAIGAAWSSCGYSIFGLWLVLMAYGFSTQNWALMNLMPSIVMIAYGSAWFIGGQIVGRGWMIGVGVLSYIGAIALGYFAHTTWTYGIYLLLLVGVALLPGLHLMKLARQARG